MIFIAAVKIIVDLIQFIGTLSYSIIVIIGKNFIIVIINWSGPFITQIKVKYDLED